MKRKQSLNPNRAIGYVRVSTDEQSLGPEAQRIALERWCLASGIELVEIHDDHGVSGGAPLDKRPGLLAAIDGLSHHSAGSLVVMKRDRLARDTMVSAMVERLVARGGGRILSTDGAGNGDGPEAMLLRGMMDLFAQYERALIRCRTSSALAVKKGRGERIGEIPLGYRLSNDGIHLEQEPDEQAAVSMIRNLRAAGVPIRKIAERLNTDGIPARGSRWHPSTIVNVLGRLAVS